MGAHEDGPDAPSASARLPPHGNVRASLSRSPQRRMAVELDRGNTEIALLKEELDIKDDRWSRLPSRRRPYYMPVERMRILQLKAARGSETLAFMGDEHPKTLLTIMNLPR